MNKNNKLYKHTNDYVNIVVKLKLERCEISPRGFQPLLLDGITTL